jgi:hypothetical protein
MNLWYYMWLIYKYLSAYIFKVALGELYTHFTYFDTMKLQILQYVYACISANFEVSENHTNENSRADAQLKGWEDMR